MNNFSNLLKSMGMVRLAALGLVAVSLLVFFAFIALRFGSEPKSLLFSDVGVEDAAKMVAELDAAKVPYELRGDGSMIYVPQSEVLRLRMMLAEKGLPAGGTVGYEIFDNADALGTTSFLQNINHLRALEGELARTIRAIDGIQGARVHLVLPERELFSRERREPTASIVLKVNRNALSSQQVKAIQYLVASAVDGLAPGRVSIVDERGTLLASGAGDDNQAIFASSVDERRSNYENRLRTHLENIIQRVVGADKARVEVTAQMDYNRITQTSDMFDPNGQVVRSTQTVEDSSSSTDGAQNDGVTVGNNLPNANLGSAEGETGSKQATNRTEETVNYEISRTTKTEVLEPGRVKRLSVAVLVDGAYAQGEDGTMVYAPRTQQELDKIEALVKSAMGFDEARGDLVEVVNLQFAPRPELGTDVALEEETAGFMSFARADIMRLVELAVLAVLALVAIFFVARPLLAKNGILSGNGVPLSLPGTAAPEGQAAISGPNGENQSAGSLPAPEQLSEDMLIDIAQVAGKVKQSSVRKIGELVSNHPDESISILRSWLHETA
ncbi:flagellar basal-body MS-ring/collar protein FliF [Parvibaculum sp.]|uniref:flagellar basal-body MS-ring/collar protein FliF n=1 Tax=Parvibaculum sp. TaxID=2024848 RepID=UPI001B0F837D|nr:flagellar M-ring protein FliF [Parvibaculum sp.]MBO6690637.1 flagellar M-ring protein FliF [Parvibaculum sp.]MBO6714990.1 flagellar M-ring protein FliF [Parvibaculum sp.]